MDINESSKLKFPKPQVGHVGRWRRGAQTKSITMSQSRDLTWAAKLAPILFPLKRRQAYDLESRK